MEVLIIKIAVSTALGFLAGLWLIYAFNRIPARWLCEYGEDPESNPRFAEELKDPHYKRIKENPWRWISAGAFICIALRLSLGEFLQGYIDVSQEISLRSGQVALAGLFTCWILGIIALSDGKYMIIPDQFVLLLAISSVGFIPVYRESFWASGILQPFIGMVIGLGVMLLGAGLGKLIFKGEAFGMGDVKLCGALGLVLGINGTVAVLCGGLLMSGIVGAAGVATGRWKATDRKPLGPYLCGAAAVYIVLAVPLIMMG